MIVSISEPHERRPHCYHRSIQHFESGELDKAESEALAAVQADPTSLQAFLRLGEAYAINNKPESALPAYCAGMALATHPQASSWRASLCAHVVKTIQQLCTSQVQLLERMLAEKALCIHPAQCTLCLMPIFGARVLPDGRNICAVCACYTCADAHICHVTSHLVLDLLPELNTAADVLCCAVRVCESIRAEAQQTHTPTEEQFTV